ncbi:ABC transporter ATP-binding protein [Candidatus Bipolaricaulota bacterium]
MSDVVVRFENLVKLFSEGTKREVRAVDDFSLSIDRGDLVTLLGPSGCGKTTSLRILAGFESATAGNVYIDEERVNDIPPQRRNTSMVFQSYGLFPHMTVLENVAYGLKVKHVPKKTIAKRVTDVLDLVSLEGLEKRSVAKLSGGQQQRVALCRAIITEPQVLLFDEPLSNLDAKLRKGTREQIRRIQQDLGITSLYVTHDQAEAMSISDSIAVMHEGKLQQLGNAEEIYAQPANRFVADFIGEANILPAVVMTVAADSVRIRLPGAELDVAQPSGTFSPGQDVELVVRPEAVDLVDPAEGDMEAIVGFSHYTGSIVQYSLILSEEQRISVQVANPLERGFLETDQRIGLRFHRRSLRILPRESSGDE